MQHNNTQKHNGLFDIVDKMNRGKSAIEIMEYSKAKSRENILLIYKDTPKEIENCINILAEQQAILLPFINFPTLLEECQKLPMLLLSNHKNIISICAALELTLDGFANCARPIFRNIYENQIIAKYCATRFDVKIYERWRDGKQIYITDGIIKRITTPQTSEIRSFWSTLSKHTHASYSSMQVYLSTKNQIDDIGENFAIITMLLKIQAELLMNYALTNETKMILKRSLIEISVKLKSAKLEFSTSYKKLSKYLNIYARRTVMNFNKKWILSKTN